MEATDLTAPLLSDLASAYAQANPYVSVVSSVVPLSALSGDLAAGRADLGLTATPDPAQFATPVGYVSFVVIVHPANAVADLSLAQLREILAGRVTDWGQLGGAGAEIQVVGREEYSDAATAFESNVLSGRPLTFSTLVAPTWAAMREAVGQNPNAIGYLTRPEFQASVKPIGLDAELRTLIVAVASAEPTGPARDFLTWAQSEAGQQIVAQRYEAVR